MMRRIPELDALRGLAALTILHFHFAVTAGFPVICCQGCWAAVDLFFVLSGYLITSIILSAQGTPGFFFKFYARRTLRIWPLYFLALAAVVALNALALSPHCIDGLPWHLVFLQNVQRYWHADPPAFDWHFKHSWTLALEEQFYILWPVLVYLVGPRRLKTLCVAVVTVAAIALLRGLHPWLLLSRCGGFALGGLLAAFLASTLTKGDEQLSPRGSRLGAGWLAAAAVGARIYLVVGRVGTGPDFFSECAAGTILAFSVLFFGIVGLVLRYHGHPALACLRSRPLRYLGQISFGIYIWHQSLFGVFRTGLDRAGLGNPVLRYACFYAASIAVAVVSWHFIEAPILRLKERFAYRKEDRTDAAIPSTVTMPTIVSATAVIHVPRWYERGANVNTTSWSPAGTSTARNK
jgi:peptidoglycan/LPS O-acetylase OafA/YrhL